MTEEFIQSNCIHCERYGEILETGTRLCNVYQDEGGGIDEELNKMHQCPLQEVKLQLSYIQKKSILDVCCGSRMFYFDKQDDRVLFCDIRELETTLCDGRPLVVKPDILADFRHLPFEDGKFPLVIFDPPHPRRVGENSWMQKKYGNLPRHDWNDYLKEGFNECWRVLRVGGTLIFKWNEKQISVGRIQHLFPSQPVIGTRTKLDTLFIVFFKSE